MGADIGPSAAECGSNGPVVAPLSSSPCEGSSFERAAESETDFHFDVEITSNFDIPQHSCICKLLLK